LNNQSQILSYAIKQLESKLCSWFPDLDAGVYQKSKTSGLIILPLGLSDSKGHNSMEKLTVRNLADDGVETEFQVPVPRRVLLKVGIIPAMENVTEILDFSGALLRFLSDDPFLDIAAFSWHGNDEGRVMMEIIEKKQEKEGIPEALCNFLPYMRVIGLELGINSGRKEKVRRVMKRQMTAVKNKN